MAILQHNTFELIRVECLVGVELLLVISRLTGDFAAVKRQFSDE